MAHQTQESRTNRKQEILQTLAMMLETSLSEKITTAALAARVGVSEAALYRHFPSKAKMYDALLDFAEDVIFSRMDGILESSEGAREQCRSALEMCLQFAELNPGISRILTGDVLVGEHERLKKRSNQIFLRLEAQLKQQLRKAEFSEGLRTRQPVGTCTDLLVAQLEGKLAGFVRSGFQKRPTTHWNEHWTLLAASLFVDESRAGEI